MDRRSLLMRAICAGIAQRCALGLGELGLALVPLQARSQPSRHSARVGWIVNLDRDGLPPLVAAFEAGMRERDRRLGTDFSIVYGYTDGDPDRLNPTVAELVRANVDVFLVSTDNVAQAVLRTGSHVPIVMTAASDPVGAGLIASLAHPGGQVTGMTFDPGPELNAKPMQYLKELRPQLKRIVVLRVPSNGWLHLERTTVESARSLGITVAFIDLPLNGEVDSAFVSAKSARADAVLFWTAGRSYTWTTRVARRALQEHLPSASQNILYARDGGLLAYGPNLADLFRRAATHVDRILRGERPGDLPMEQPTSLELVVNRRTATALGIELSPALLARADRVID